VLDDLGHAWRVYCQTPFQSALALLTLAVAMAFATAFFKLYSDLSLGSLPGVEDPQGIVSLGLSENDYIDSLRPSLIQILNEQSTALEVVSAYTLIRPDIESPMRLDGRIVAAVTDNFFPDMGIALAYGEGLGPDVVHRNAAVISHRMAETLFDDPATAVGEELRFSGQSYQVLGVAESGFTGLNRSRDIDVWIGSEFLIDELWSLPSSAADGIPYQAYARPLDDVELQAAERELDQIAAQLPQQYRDPLRGQSLRLSPELSSDPEAHQAAQKQLMIMVSGAGLVGLIAAGNLGLFLLSRAATRRREMAIRMMLGATYHRLARQIMTETSCLVLMSGVLGGLMALWLSVYLQGLPIFAEAAYLDRGLDWRVLLFSLGMTLIFALLAGLAPILGLSRSSLISQSRRGHQHQISRKVIGSAQLVLSLIVISGGLYTQHSLQSGLALDAGARMDGITRVTFDFSNPATIPTFKQESIDAFRADIRDRLKPLDEVKDLGFAGIAPATEQRVYESIAPLGSDPQERSGLVTGWEPSVFNMLELELFQGRLPDENQEQEVVVNRFLAETVWGRSDILGEQLEVGSNRWGGGGETDHRTVVGVIDSMRFGHPRESLRPLVISGQADEHYLAELIIDGQLDRQMLVDALSDYLDKHTPPLRIATVEPLADAHRRLYAADSSRAQLTSLGAGIVLIMALLGFYGTQRYIMDRQRFELGLRAAMGASPRMLYRQAMKSGLVFMIPGLFLGLPIATILLASLANHLGAVDVSPLPSVLMASVLILMAFLATMHPIAQGAAKRQPGPILRSE